MTASPETARLFSALWRNAQQPGMSLQELRLRFDDAAQRAPVAPGVRVVSDRVNGLAAEWLRPPAVLAEGRVVLYFHGGGYVVGSLNSVRCLASNLAKTLGVDLLALDYRLGPEYPFPACVEDGVLAYRLLLERGHAPHEIALAGDSAGGGLCIAVLLALRDGGYRLPAGGLCFSPWLDLTLESRTFDDNAATDPIVQRWILAEMADWYLAGQDPKEPLASPTFADLRALPPLLLQVSSAECLAGDTARFAQVASDAGVEVTSQTWADMPHVWHAFAPRLPEAQQALLAAGDWLSTRWRMSLGGRND